MQCGYQTEGDEGSFDFVTIRNAGHMVPRYKPAASLAMMRAFLEERAELG